MKSLKMPPTSVKKLYVGKCLEDLENAYKLDSSIQSKNTAGLIGLADRIFTTAEMYYTDYKDEEKAFIQYSKFVELVLILKQKPDFQKYPYHIKLSMNVNTAVKRAEQLKDSLEKRYLYLDTDSCFENGDLNQFPQGESLKQNNSESSNVETLTTKDMERPIADSQVRKEVFTFFSSVLQNYSEPVYYEYIRGHVSKAPFAVRKYVTSKLKGEKFLEYFKLRKNYFTVEGTEVTLNEKPHPKRTRGRSECVTSETSRGRKPSVKRDKSRTKRSQSCSSAVSDNAVESSSASINNADEKLEHEDFVNKFFFDLIFRHEKVDIHSLEYDYFPKKVKRHLDLYYKRKVANYFAQFPDKYIIDDDWKVSFNLQFSKDSCMATASKSDKTDTQQNGQVIQAKEQSTDCEVKEIQSTLRQADAVLFFMAILTKSPKPIFTVQQLGALVSHAPKEQKAYFKLNYTNFKSFFEEYPSIFLLNGCEEVTLSNLSSNLQASYEDMRKVAHKASVGDISFQVFKERLKVLKDKIKTYSDSHSDKPKENGDKVVADALSDSSNEQAVSKKLQKSSTDGSTVKLNENKLNSCDKNSCKVVEESAIDNVQSTAGCGFSKPSTHTQTIAKKSVGTQHEIQDLSKMKLNVEHAISSTLSNYEYFGISSENVVFEINGSLYLPTCEPFLGDNYFYEDELNAEELFKAGKRKVVKIVPTPCVKHKKNVTGVKDTTELQKKFMSQVQKINDENFYRLFLMVDLFCLEMTEKDFDFTVSSEIGAIQHFIEVLNQPSRKTWSTSNLYNTIGKANEEVASYIRKKYKVDNFISFFKKQPEFEVTASIVNLSASYKDTFARRSKVFSVSRNRNSKWDLLKLFESSCYQNTLKEVLLILEDVCYFLDNKFKAKLTKLEKILKPFPICLDWIKALEGETMAKKTKLFLELFDIFDFPTGQYISFQKTYYNEELMNWFYASKKYFDQPNPNSDLVTIFHKVGNQTTASLGNENSVLGKEYVAKFDHFLKEDIKNQTPLNYHELAKIIPEDLINQFINSGITSRNLIHAILKNGQYFLKNCQINLKTSEDKPDDLGNAANNLFSSNEKVLFKEETSCESEVISNETLSTKQIKDSNCQVNFDTTAFCESNAMDSSNSTCVTDSNNSNTSINNQHNLQSTLSTCVTDITQSDLSLESSESNFFSGHENVLFTEETSGRSDKVILREAGSTQQIKDSNSQVNCANSAFCETNALNTSIPTYVTDTINSLDAITNNQHNLQSILSTWKSNLLNCSNPTTDAINNFNAITKNQHILQSILSTCDYNSLNRLAPNVIDAINYLNTIINDFNAITKNQHYLQPIFSTSDTRITESLSMIMNAFAVKDSTEKNTDHSNGVIKSLTSEVPPQNLIEHEEEFVTSVDEIRSLGHKHSMSKNEGLAHLDEEYRQTSIETNSPVSDGSYIESHVASPENISDRENCDTKSAYLNFNSQSSIETKANDVSNDNCVDTSFSRLSATKSILLNQDEMEKYLELLKMDDVCTEDAANQNDAYGDGKVPNQTTATSKVSLASDLDCSSSAKELSKEHKTTDILDSTKSKADCLNDAAKEKVKKKRKKRKSITKLTGTEHVSEDACLPTQIAAEELPDISSKCPLLGDTSSIKYKDRPESCGSNDKKHDTHSCKENLEVNDNLKSTEDLSAPDNYPLQPILAEIVLLTTDSCIAVAKVNSRMQNIYFLKCVFSCDNKNCCSDCFNLLKVGDIVSCFVPPTEISRKMWVAFMVSKEDSCYFNEINSFNETIIKQSKDSYANHNMCVKSKSVSTETEYSSVELECNLKPLANEASQTNVSGDIKLSAITKDSMCQMNTLVDFASMQTLSEVCSSDCQTDTIDAYDIESQTSHVEFKEIANCVENSCQTNLTGEVKEIGNLTDSESQTISTGVVMITKYYHL